MNKNDVLEIFSRSIKAIQPASIIPQHISLSGNSLLINNKRIADYEGNKIKIIAAGKAAAAMASETENILGEFISSGLCITKHNHALPLKKFITIECGHPVPDENSIKAAEMAIRLINEIEEGEILLVLISGGASSLIADIPDGCNLEELQKTFDALLKSGASISEMNIVRKHLSKLKGGQLAKAAHKAKIYSFIISDVPADDLESIGSGLTVADSSTFSNALAIIQKYNLYDTLPEKVINYLESGVKGLINETPKPGDSCFTNVENFIIANNAIALQMAKFEAEKRGFTTQLNKQLITGETGLKAKEFADLLINYKGTFPFCFIAGGETTLKVTGNGKGGRNLHFALCVLQEMKEQWVSKNSFAILCAGTDGTDGPTDAAGALITSDMLQTDLISSGEINDFLNRFDSYTFFEKYGGLVKTGPTQTNVMDMTLGIIYPR